MSSHASPLLTLPDELVELILIIAAANNAPQSIACLSQTCKYFFELVYRSSDRFLWREVFLLTFDDPRPALAHFLKLYGDHPSLGVDDFDWSGEYRRRIHARAIIRQKTRLLVFADAITSGNERSALSSSSNVSGSNRRITRSMAHTAQNGHLESLELLSVMKTLLSAITTSSPFPSSPTISFTIITAGSSPSNDPLATTFTRTPPFPPLVLLLSSTYPSTLESKNAVWLEDVLRNGFPPELARILYARLSIDRNEQGLHAMSRQKDVGALTQASYWQKSELAMLFHKLVCWTGFIPIRNPQYQSETPGFGVGNVETSRSGSVAQEGSGNSAAPGHSGNAVSETDPTSEHVDLLMNTLPLPTFPLDDEQFGDVRCLARRRVYDMRYLRPERAWGPYLPVYRPPSGADSSLHKRSIIAGGELEEVVQHTLHEDHDESDGDDREVDDDDDDDFSPIVHLITGHGEPLPTSLSPPIVPSELRPDWVWLSSARLVVEANLRGMFLRARLSEGPMGEMGGETGLNLSEIVAALRRLETLRIGGSPGYWNAWGDEGPWAAVDTNCSGDQVGNLKGKGKSNAMNTPVILRNVEQMDGWDWAGCEGLWRRCVCWLDYRELLVHNLNPSRFHNRGTQEALRIVSMKLHIVGYSRPPLPSTSSASSNLKRYLPIIHVEGDMAGPETGPENVRTVSGTVSMIGDGDIRYSLVSTAAGASDPEWATEAVQIGNPGSACGLVGMWTGAQHERTDPLGPFWAWKVS